MWAVWDKNGAVGYGNYLENDCQPSCAEGTFSQTPVYVTLGELTTRFEKSFLRNLVISPDLGGELPMKQKMINWDLFEFGKMISEERKSPS